MEILPITYRGRTVAACTPTRMYFSDALEAHETQAPPRQFVCAMCL